MLSSPTTRAEIHASDAAVALLPQNLTLSRRPPTLSSLARDTTLRDTSPSIMRTIKALSHTTSRVSSAPAAARVAAAAALALAQGRPRRLDRLNSSVSPAHSVHIFPYGVEEHRTANAESHNRKSTSQSQTCAVGDHNDELRDAFRQQRKQFPTIIVPQVLMAAIRG
jgi:hypothetical protein